MSKLSGRRITRGGTNRPWRYRFEINGHPFKGACENPPGHPIWDKAEAEEWAERKYLDEERRATDAARLGREPIRAERACAVWLAGHDAELVGASLDDETLTPGKRWALTLFAKYGLEAEGELRERGLAEQTRWLCDVIGPQLYLHEFRGEHITRVRDRRRKTRVREGGEYVADKTVNKTLALLRRILHFVEHDDRHQAEVRHFKWDKYFLEVEKSLPNPISEAKQARIFETLRDDYAPITEFALASGLRSTENILRWRQIDWEDCVALKVAVKSRGRRRKTRDVELGPVEMEILREQYELLDEDPAPDDFVFTYVAKRTYYNKRADKKFIAGKRYPVTEAGWKSEWARMKARGDLEGHNRHRLRHTAGTRIGREGGLEAVMKSHGHTNVSTSLLYVQIDGEKVRAAKATAPRARDLKAKKVAKSARPTLELVRRKAG